MFLRNNTALKLNHSISSYSYSVKIEYIHSNITEIYNISAIRTKNRTFEWFSEKTNADLKRFSAENLFTLVKKNDKIDTLL